MAETPAFHPLFDLFLRLMLTLAFNVVQLRIVTHKKPESKAHVYSFIIISTIVFFLAFALRSFDMQLGMAIGMFAVFGIVRYRTEVLDIKEMAYLFSALGIAVINALAGDTMGWWALLGINSVVLLLIVVLEVLLTTKNQQRRTERKVTILVPLEDLSDEHLRAKMGALEATLELPFARYQVSKVDYLNQLATVVLFYEE